MKTLSTIAAFTILVAASAPAFAQTARIADHHAYQAEASQYDNAPVLSGRSVGQYPGFRCNANGSSVSPNGNPSLSDPRSC